MKTLTHAVSLILLCSASARAASDTDVTLIKAEKVVIEDSVITIIGKARTRARLVSDDGGSTWMGRRVASVTIDSDRATFTIKKPELNFNDPYGSHAVEKEKTRKILEEGWAMSLAAAKDLQAGKEVGRIGFYAPDITIKGNLIETITGFGYLYAKPKPAEHVVPPNRPYW